MSSIRRFPQQIDAAPLDDEADCIANPFAGTGLPADEDIRQIEREIAEAFGWREAYTDADWTALERIHDEQRAQEAADELVAKYPGLADKPDQFLIDLVSNPPGLMSDVADVAKVAAILLERRLARYADVT